MRSSGPRFVGAPSIAFTSLQADAGTAPDITVQGRPTGAYGIAVARLLCPESVRVSGTPADHMLGFTVSSLPVHNTVWMCGRRTDHGLRPRGLAVTPAGADSVAEVSGPAEAILVRVSKECFDLAKAQLASPGTNLVERIDGRDDPLFQIVRHLEAEVSAGCPNGPLYWSSAADALIRHLVEHHLSAEAPSAQQAALSLAAFRRLDAYIQDNLAEPLDLDSLADVVGCGRFHLARRFRATVGVTPHRYVVRRRLDRARTMLRARKGSPVEVALATGFSDQSHLGHWLRRIDGTTPAQLIRG